MPFLAISISGDVNKLKARLDDLGRRQLPFAESLAVNRLARQAVADIQEEMKKVFDRPTPYTLTAFYAHGGTKRNPTAEILAREGSGKGTPGWKYLTPEVFGGLRNMKRFERALGAKFGSGFTVPGRDAPLNAFGNLSQGFIEKILSALGAAEQRAGYSANRGHLTRRQLRSQRASGEYRRAQFFLAHSRSDGSILGIYQVVSPGHVEPVIIFPHRAPSYRARFPYAQTAQTSVKQHARQFLDEAIGHAIATAK